MGRSIEVLDYLFDKYHIECEDKIKIISIIKKILLHDEFQKRLQGNFYHHGSVMLGEHILEDTIVTYLLCQKCKRPINIEIALKIAMMHDLYTRPWQNSNIKKQFFHRHGFSHPIESVINSSIWFKDEFDNLKGYILVDGIVHHMFPFPVTSYKDYNYNKLELNNYELSKKMPENIKRMLIDSSNRTSLGEISFIKSKFYEGRIMSQADRIVSFGQIKDKDSLLALVTGENKKLLIKK